MDVTQENFRKTLGQFITGVSVITTIDAASQPVGITINSLASVSLEPPLILFCLKKISYLLPIFEKAPAFAVNILTLDQSNISNMFALNSKDKWQKTEFEYNQKGLPIIKDTQATIICEPHQSINGGDHIIFIGKVIDLAFNSNKSPLAYFQGQYTHI